VIDRLIDAHRALIDSNTGAESVIWAPAASGRRGHPVLFPWPLAAELDRLAANEGLNALLARHRVHTVEAEARTVLEDLDTPADYERLRPAGNE
jgi:molybdenum cofactor cytidylyltransferase